MTTQEFDDLDIYEQEAFGLSRAAVLLDQARSTPDDPLKMTQALQHNLELWVAIRALVSREDNNLPDEVKNNLSRLSKYVADTTFKTVDGISDQVMDSLININLQISEGLLEGAKK